MKTTFSFNNTMMVDGSKFDFIKPCITSEINIPDELINKLAEGGPEAEEAKRKIRVIYKRCEELTSQIFKQVCEKNLELFKEEKKKQKEEKLSELESITFE